MAVLVLEPTVSRGAGQLPTNGTRALRSGGRSSTGDVRIRTQLVLFAYIDKEALRCNKKEENWFLITVRSATSTRQSGRTPPLLRSQVGHICGVDCVRGLPHRSDVRVVQGWSCRKACRYSLLINILVVIVMIFLCTQAGIPFFVIIFRRSLDRHPAASASTLGERCSLYHLLHIVAYRRGIRL